MGPHVEIFDLEEGESVVWQMVSPVFSNIHDLERDEEILLARAVLEEEIKTPSEIMDEIDRRYE